MNLPQFREAAPQIKDVRGASRGLDAFDTESGELSRPTQRPKWLKPLLLIAIILTLGGGLGAYMAYIAAAAPPPMASLSIQTTPPGAQVTIDGREIGQTPTSTTLPAGTYAMLLTSVSGQQRQMEVTLRSGDTLVHQFEWAEPVKPVLPVTGALHVLTEPPGQTVFVDDTRRGLSPMTVSDLSPGEHSVSVTGSAGTLRRAVTIAAGETLSMVVAPNTPAVSAGWLRISSPVLLQLHVDGNLVGNTESDRVMLPAGQHDVDISNSALGFSVTRRVNVSAGRTAEMQITPPNGRLSINAIPWADVWLNGERLGQTPIANLSRPIGTHDVILRHPELGERRATVTVSLKETARLGIDMRRP